MSPIWLDDVAIERLVVGDEVDTVHQQLAGFARAVCALGDEPVPAPSPALDALLTAGRPVTAVGPAASTVRSRRGTTRVLTERLSGAAAKIATLGIVAKVGLGTAVAAAGVAGAGAGGILPDQANDRVRELIEAVTPVDFGRGREHPGEVGTEADTDQQPGAQPEGRGTATPGRPDSTDVTSFGDEVSDDATGESDAERGVDGDEISDEAPGAGNRPPDRGRQGDERGNRSDSSND